MNQDNRGQLATGIASNSGPNNTINTPFKKIGTPGQVFTQTGLEQICRKHAGTQGIGHLRYATSGANDEECAQPSARQDSSREREFAHCFNGNIANWRILRNRLLEERPDYVMKYDNDTEVLTHHLAYQLNQRIQAGNVQAM